MREIEFRALKEILTEENKKYTNGWVYSDTLYVDDNGTYLIPLGISAESYRLGAYNFRANSDRFEIMVAKIKPETLCQYIGLKDANNKKIFEGDIIEFYYKPHNQKHRAVVEFDSYLCGWLLNGVNCGVFKFNYDISIKECEIIGNIHDNPELLKVI